MDRLQSTFNFRAINSSQFFHVRYKNKPKTNTDSSKHKTFFAYVPEKNDSREGTHELCVATECVEKPR